MPADQTQPARAIIIIATVAVIGVAAVVAVALLSQPPASSQDQTAAPSPTPTAAMPMQQPQPTLRPGMSVPRAANSPSPVPNAPAPAPIAWWESQIDNVLNSNANEAQMAQILLNMLPTLPEEGQIEVANHIANILPDENYNVLKPVLLNPRTSEPVPSVLFTDRMNREDAPKLRSFLDIANMSSY